MGRKQRLVGFVVCLLSGVFFMFLSTFFIPLIVLKPSKFAVSFTFGNVLCLARYVQVFVLLPFFHAFQVTVFAVRLTHAAVHSFLSVL